MSIAEEEASPPPPQQASPLRGFLERHRGHILRIAVELVVVFIGVTAAFALENWRRENEEAKYRRQMLAALITSIDRIADHNLDIQSTINARVSAFEAALAKGERPAPPVYRESGGERPPTQAWDGIVVTGVARALEPNLYFRLNEYFNRVNSFGERYLRYNDFTEQRVLPYVGEDTSAFYTPSGALRGEYRAYVDRLRDLSLHCEFVAENAAEVKADLQEAIKN